MKINFCNLDRQYKLLKKDIDKNIAAVLKHGIFIDGPEIAKLEERLAKYLDVKEAITVSSGTDALYISLLGLNIGAGDFVITTPFTFIATAEVISLLGARPIFIDIEEDTFNISPEKIEQFLKSAQDPITKAKTPLDKIKAIIPVDLFGQCADYEQINKIAKKYNLFVIEDGAQSFGAEYKGKKALSLAQVSTTSFYPAKPLGCFGDGGAIFTDNKELADKLRCLRNHGQEAKYKHKFVGLNGRLDTLQAAILLAKLDIFINKEISARDKVAVSYRKTLKNLEDRGHIILPKVREYNKSIWAQFSLRVLGDKRDALQAYLQTKAIPTAIHYPIPLHLQKAYSNLGYKIGDFPVAEKISKQIISLPMNAYLEAKEIEYITSQLILGTQN